MDIPPMLEIDALSRSFSGRQVLAEVSLRLAPGDYVAIVGESGVGKSTLLNLIAGLDRPDSGRVVLDGADYTTLDEDGLTRLRRDRLGFVFQAFHVLPHLTVLQNVALPLWLLLDTNYTVTADTLQIRSGPFRWRIALSDVREVSPSRSWVSSPALSLDRVRIRYGVGRSILVSPREKQRFIDSLRELFVEVRENATSLNAGIDSLNTVTRSVAAESERQAETLTTTAATIEEITVSINHIASNAGSTDTATSRIGLPNIAEAK